MTLVMRLVGRTEMTIVLMGCSFRIAALPTVLGAEVRCQEFSKAGEHLQELGRSHAPAPRMPDGFCPRRTLWLACDEVGFHEMGFVQ